MKKTLINKSKFEHDNTVIELKYYQTENVFDERCSNPESYGVAVTMTQMYGTGSIINIEKRISSIFYSEYDVHRFIEILVKNKVTPTTLQEVAEEYILNKLCIENLAAI